MDESIESLYSALEGQGDETTDVVSESEQPAEPTPVGEEPTPVAEQPQEAEQPDWSPDGPGDLREALRQEREQLRFFREQMDLQQQQLQQYQAWYQQQQQAAAQEQQRQYLEELADDPDQLQAYLQQQQQAAWQQAQQSQVTYKLQMAADLARQTLPDFDQQLGKIYNLLGPDVVDSMAAQQANPALWAYEFAKNFSMTPDEINARVEAEVQKRLAQIAPRAQVKQSTNSRGIGHLPASGQNIDASPQSELFKALNFGVNNNGFDAAYSKLLEAAGQ